ncbi:actin-like ATPase domain-containing protein [Penicillium herquei]|nr:actin-like ATPase domain-containing protein [Penicillium herquei]
MRTRNYDIVVGVDFGTTASAIGYSSSLLGIPYHHAKLIKQLPAQPVTEKIPSVLAYIQDNPNLQESKWGFSALSHPNRSSWFKLFLDGDHENEIESWEAEALRWARTLGIMSLPSEISPIDAISDYLGALKVIIWDHLKGELTMADKSLETSTIRRAGFRSRDCNDFHLLTEADAIIAFALSNLRRDEGTSPLKACYTLIICDGGGGTVDIASFLISEHNTRVYDKLAPGSGTLCGSTSVDREFYKLMQERFGGLFSSLQLDQTGLSTKFMNDFMEIKHAFTGYGDMIFKLHLDMNVSRSFNPEWYDQRTQTVILSSTDLLKLFQPSVSTIIKCLTLHMNNANTINKQAPAIKKILLVGGFSRSPFLQSEIIRAFHNMTIIVDGQYALTAVVRGAIAWGSGKIELRIMRSPCHFGFANVNPVRLASQPNVSLMNATSSVAFQNVEINWIVKKGQRFRMDEKIQAGYFFIHQEGDFNTKVIDILSSRRNNLPTTVSERGSSKIGTLPVDISGIDFSHCVRSDDGGRSAWQVNYMISAHLGDTDGTIHFDVYWEGNLLIKWEFKPGFIRY